ncbi:proline iminopeptidase-family hydrolase [Aquirufa novilacunae]|uniref:Proline iminopeptidase-family hydrolase n=1 Tax=Aquirufa novilacunae TaxID=3139305 RepID=A0ABW8U458_9BACT
MKKYLLGLYTLLMMNACTTYTPPKEGFIEVEGGKIWYRIDGEGDKTPVLLLHGGPGSSSFNLEPLKELSQDRPVIFLDQLGCGRSTRITDTTLMTIEKNVEQLEQVRKALKLDKFYLYGHSWGTMLGMDYYVKYPKGIQGLIFSSPLFSTKIWTDDADTLIATLPEATQKAIRESEQQKNYKNEAYKEAMKVYYKAYVRRSDKSKSQQDTSAKFFGENVYNFMWGPSEFTATGNLLNYNRLKDLPKITVPTLLTAGEYDEARPSSVRYYTSLIPGAQFKEIPQAAHSTMMDNPKEYIGILREFLKKMDVAK